MKDQHWIQLFVVLAGLAWWLLGLLRRWSRARQVQTGQDPVQPDASLPAPETIFEEPDEELTWARSRIRDDLHSLLERATTLLELCRSPSLVPFARIVDTAVTARIGEMSTALDHLAPGPGARQGLWELGHQLRLVERVLAVLDEAVMTHLQPDHERRTARSVRVATLFLARLDSLTSKGAVQAQNPYLFALPAARDLDFDVLCALAEAGALPVEAEAGRHPNPLAWGSLATDVCTWFVARMTALGEEVAGHHRAVLEAAGYEPRPPAPQLVARVFADVAAAAMLGPSWPHALERGFAFENRARARASLDVARRLALLDSGDVEEEGPGLDLETEILFRILTRVSLASLGGNRVIDDLHLVFDVTDRVRSAEVAACFAAGEDTQVRGFHLVVGAMQYAATPGASIEPVSRFVHRALGTDSLVGEEAPDRGAGDDDTELLGTAALIEAIVLGAALESRRPAR